MTVEVSGLFGMVVGWPPVGLAFGFVDERLSCAAVVR